MIQGDSTGVKHCGFSVTHLTERLLVIFVRMNAETDCLSVNLFGSRKKKRMKAHCVVGKVLFHVKEAV